MPPPLLRLLVSLFQSDTEHVGDQRHPESDLANSQNKYVQDGDNFYSLNFSNTIKVTMVKYKDVLKHRFPNLSDDIFKVATIDLSHVTQSRLKMLN